MLDKSHYIWVPDTDNVVEVIEPFLSAILGVDTTDLFAENTTGSLQIRFSPDLLYYSILLDIHVNNQPVSVFLRIFPFFEIYDIERPTNYIVLRDFLG